MKKFVITLLTVLCLATFSTNTCFAFNSIKQGDRGDNVKEVQQILKDLGYLNGSVDGAFGAMTADAVTRFQSENGLDATGIIGEATYNALIATTRPTVTTQSVNENTEVTDDIQSGDAAGVETSTENTVSAETATSDQRPLLSNVVIKESDLDLRIIDAGYSISDGYLFFGVILHNFSESKPYGYPTIRFTARNASGNIIGTGDHVVGTIYPGQDYADANLGFELNEEPAVVEFDLSLPEYDSTPEHATYIPLEVVGVSEKTGEFNDRSYLGEVINHNDYDLSGAAIVVLFRNTDGALIGGDTGYPSGTLGKNSSIPFNVFCMSNANYASYEVSAHPW